jgi:histidinol-phosphate/aromatic aminotransferase/cobyric acid decarboxylase-like protein
MKFDELSVSPRIHGGISHALRTSLGAEAEGLLDLSVNVNPYGPSPAVLSAIRSAPFAAYPDPQAGALKEDIAVWADVRPTEVVVGNGAADLIWTLVRTLLPPGSRALIAEPTFCEFRAACLANQVFLREYRGMEQEDFRFDLDALSAAVLSFKPKCVYLCNPNSPTGGFVPTSAIREFADRHSDLYVILDEAFLSLSLHYQEAEVSLPPNVVRLRSFTKEHTIAGLRVGYLLTTPVLAQRIESQRPAWTINSIAEAAARAALTQDEFVALSRRRIFADLAGMQAALREVGLSPRPTSTLYFLVPMPGGVDWRDVLLRRHGILVRDCGSYGLSGYIRLCSRPAPDVARLTQALEKELAKL